MERLGHTPLSEKENKLLNTNFGYEDIDQLEEVLINAETKQEYDKLVNFFLATGEIF